MKIRNKLINYYNNFTVDDNIFLSCLFGGFLICLIIWNRVFRIRLPRDLVPIEWSFLTSIICLLMFFYISLLLYTLLKWYKVIPREKSRFKIYFDKLNVYINNNILLTKSINIIKAIIEQHIIYGPHRIYDRLYKTYINVAFYMNKFTDVVGTTLHKYLWAIPKSNTPLILYYCLIYVIPKMFPAIIFIFEVIYCQHLHYFYKSLFLLIIPLLSNIVLFVLQNSVESRMNYIQKFYKVEKNVQGKNYTMVMEKNSSKDNEYNDFFVLYKTEANLATKWINYQAIYNIVNQIEIQIEHYKYYLKISCYALFALGFFFYFLILQGVYDQINLISGLNGVKELFLQMTLFQKITLSILFSFIIARVFFVRFLKALYNYLYIYINIKDFYNLCNIRLIDMAVKPKQCLFYYLLFFGLPYIVSFITILFETLFCNNIYYFYASLYILLIPLIIKLFLYIIQHHAKSCIEYYETFFIIEHDPKLDVMHITYKHLDNPEDIEESKEFDPRFVIDSWLDYHKTLNVYHIIKNLIRKDNIKLIYTMLFIILLMGGYLII